MISLKKVQLKGFVTLQAVGKVENEFEKKLIQQLISKLRLGSLRKP